MAPEPTKVRCSGLKYYLLRDVTELPVEAEWTSMLSGMQYTFTPGAVQCRVRSLLKRDEWEAPLSAYRGVLTQRKQYGKNSYLYMVVLRHEERRAWDVVLYQSLSAEGLRARQEECALLLGLPTLIETEDGYAERPPEDLDKSVRQRVAEGTLEVAFDPASGPPGSRLSISIEGDCLRLRSRPSPLWAVALLPMLLFGLAVLLSGPLGVHSLRRVPGWAGWLFLAAGAGGSAWVFLVIEELLVSPREVRRCFSLHEMTFAETAVPSDQIEEVYVGKLPDGSGGNRVRAVADTGSVSYGDALTKAQRHWVRDCIIAVISK